MNKPPEINNQKVNYITGEFFFLFIFIILVILISPLILNFYGNYAYLIFLILLLIVYSYHSKISLSQQFSKLKQLSAIVNGKITSSFFTSNINIEGTWNDKKIIIEMIPGTGTEMPKINVNYEFKFPSFFDILPGDLKKGFDLYISEIDGNYLYTNNEKTLMKKFLTPNNFENIKKVFDKGFNEITIGEKTKNAYSAIKVIKKFKLDHNNPDEVKPETIIEVLDILKDFTQD